MDLGNWICMHRETGSYLFMVIATCQRKFEPFLVLHIVVNYYTISIFEIEIQRHYIGSLCVVVLSFSSCRRPCLKIQFGIFSISGLKFKLNPHILATFDELQIDSQQENALQWSTSAEHLLQLVETHLLSNANGSIYYYTAQLSCLFPEQGQQKCPQNFSTWKLLIGITLWKLPNGMAIDPGNSPTEPLYCLGVTFHTQNEKYIFYTYR